MKPWVHLFVSHYGTVVPCCITPWEKDQALGDINSQTVQEIWNGKEIGELRIKMLQDKQDKRCWQCYENERVGLFSDRKETNFRFADKLDWALNTNFNGTSDQSKPIHWDIRISNLCNLKCRICGHHSSSHWYEDAKALGLLSFDTKVNRGTKDFDKLLKQLDFVIPDLEEIYFAGGEPLLMEEHYRVLRHLIERGKTNIRLDYNTNFSHTYFNGHDLFELWAHFDKVNVLASLDGSGKRGELQRSGQKWDLVLANRERMKAVCPNVNFAVTPTISVFNIFHLPDFHREWAEKGLIDVDEMMPHSLKNPLEYDIRILPLQLKKRAEENLQRHIEWMIEFCKTHPPKPLNITQEQLDKWGSNIHWVMPPYVTGYGKLDVVIREYKNTITLMNSSDESHLIPKFRESCAKLDALRKEDTRAVFPELAELWE